MSSASAGSVGDNTERKNHARANDERTVKTHGPGMHAVATSSAEAQQGDGPAAASASGAAVSEVDAEVSNVAVAVGSDYAAAAGPFGVVVVGPNSAAAAGEIGVASVGPEGAAASSNAANGSDVAVNNTRGNNGKRGASRKTGKS